ncbi:hypothetical protein PLICRDRAFT_181022, partial [Plicaturopsis crispa FD-325 SS-3]
MSPGDLTSLLGLRALGQLIPSCCCARRCSPPRETLIYPSTNPHIQDTWRLCTLYTGEKAMDNIVALMQQQRLIEPVPSSIWRVIIKDQYVDFEKLFASMETGYNHRDEPQDFHAGFALVKKDQATARKPLQSEADWLRVFGAWQTAIVISLFRRQLPLDPHIGIFSFDRDIRETYDKSPFSLDDRNQLAVPIFAQ